MQRIHHHSLRPAKAWSFNFRYRKCSCWVRVCCLVHLKWVILFHYRVPGCSCSASNTDYPSLESASNSVRQDLRAEPSRQAPQSFYSQCLRGFPQICIQSRRVHNSCASVGFGSFWQSLATSQSVYCSTTLLSSPRLWLHLRPGQSCLASCIVWGLYVGIGVSLLWHDLRQGSPRLYTAPTLSTCSLPRSWTCLFQPGWLPSSKNQRDRYK